MSAFSPRSRRRAGQGMVETGLVMGLVAILAVAILWGLSEWLSGTFVEEAEGTGAANVEEFYDEMADIADGRQINSTTVPTTTSTTTTATTTTATSTTSTTSTGSSTTSTVSTSTTSTSTTVPTTTTTSTSTTSTSSTSTGSSTSSTSTTSTSSTSTSTSSTTTTTTTIPACNPTITSVKTADGSCYWSVDNQSRNVKKNTTFTVEVILGGTTPCVTGVEATYTGNAIASITPASDATSPYQFTITVQNAAALWARVTFKVMENTVVKFTKSIEIATVNSSSCP